MNVLFVTSDRVSPQSGGIARATYLLADGFVDEGIKSISAYLHQNESIHSAATNVFEQDVHVKDEDHTRQYLTILTSYDVDFVIVQGGSAEMNQELLYIRESINSQSRKVPLFLAFHSMPGYELYFLDWSILIRKIFSKAWKEYCKQFLLQIMMLMNKKLLQKQLYQKYHIPYQTADKIILLSPSYVEDYNMLARGIDRSKILSIPNMLTFPIEGKISFDKGKEVLIVARMDERSKRIKLALRIWGSISHKILEQGWKLTIVGDGEDLTYYKEYVEKHNIKNVSFEGRQNPLPYYQRADIFMMTSALEGWPMTLMEAMQNGCVPIVFDSFKAVYDIVDGNRGIIVPNNDVETYIRELERLMRDDDYRKRLAKNALKDCQRFSKDRIVGQWFELFNSYNHN